MEITEREIEALQVAWECQVTVNTIGRPERRGRLSGSGNAFTSVDDVERTFIHLWADNYLKLGPERSVVQ